MDVVDALYSRYGEKASGGIRAGHQNAIFESGNAYLDANFPLLDRIEHAKVVDR
jgi:hypothetical protein